MADKPPAGPTPAPACVAGPAPPRRPGRLLPPKVPPPVEVRVARIRELMEAGDWGRRQRRQLAIEWGISDSRMRDHSAEACRQLEPIEREAAQARFDAMLDRALELVRYEKSPARAQVACAALWAKVHGLDRGRGAGGAGGGSSGARELEGSDEGTEEKDDFWG